METRGRTKRASTSSLSVLSRLRQTAASPPSPSKQTQTAVTSVGSKRRAATSPSPLLAKRKVGVPSLVSSQLASSSPLTTSSPLPSKHKATVPSVVSLQSKCSSAATSLGTSKQTTAASGQVSCEQRTTPPPQISSTHRPASARLASSRRSATVTSSGGSKRTAASSLRVSSEQRTTVSPCISSRQRPTSSPFTSAGVQAAASQVILSGLKARLQLTSKRKGLADPPFSPQDVSSTSILSDEEPVTTERAAAAEREPLISSRQTTAADSSISSEQTAAAERAMLISSRQTAESGPSVSSKQTVLHYPLILPKGLGFHHLMFDSKVSRDWKELMQKLSLQSDSQLAALLIQHYNRTRGLAALTECVLCRGPLNQYCVKCHVYITQSLSSAMEKSATSNCSEQQQKKRNCTTLEDKASVYQGTAEDETVDDVSTQVSPNLTSSAEEKRKPAESDIDTKLPPANAFGVQIGSKSWGNTDTMESKEGILRMGQTQVTSDVSMSQTKNTAQQSASQTGNTSQINKSAPQNASQSGNTSQINKSAPKNAGQPSHTSQTQKRAIQKASQTSPASQTSTTTSVRQPSYCAAVAVNHAVKHETKDAESSKNEANRKHRSRHRNVDNHIVIITPGGARDTIALPSPTWPRESPQGSDAQKTVSQSQGDLGAKVKVMVAGTSGCADGERGGGDLHSDVSLEEKSSDIEGEQVSDFGQVAVDGSLLSGRDEQCTAFPNKEHENGLAVRILVGDELEDSHDKVLDEDDKELENTNEEELENIDEELVENAEFEEDGAEIKEDGEKLADVNKLWGVDGKDSANTGVNQGNGDVQPKESSPAETTLTVKNTAKALRGCVKVTTVVPAKGYDCQQCGKRLQSRRSLEGHMRIHRGETPYVCTQCPAKFSLPRSFKYHCKVHENGPRFQCSECHQAFFRPVDLKEHMVLHANSQAVACVCQMCGSVLDSEAELKSHIKQEHTEKQKYWCSVCGLNLRRREGFLNHQKIHQNALAYSCPHCPKKYNQSRSLQQHIERNHMENRPRTHVCEICGVARYSKSQLDKHRMIHTGEKPHQCGVCGAAFIQLNALKGHMKIHTETAGKKNWCSLCGAAFKRFASIKKHIRKVHSDVPEHSLTTIEIEVDDFELDTGEDVLSKAFSTC